MEKGDRKGGGGGGRVGERKGGQRQRQKDLDGERERDGGKLQKKKDIPLLYVSVTRNYAKMGMWRTEFLFDCLTLIWVN